MVKKAVDYMQCLGTKGVVRKAGKILAISKG